MDFNSSDYFSYKKNKLQARGPRTDKPISKFNFLLQLFIATFVIIFIIIAVSIMKFSSKVDIEYSKGDLYHTQEGMEYSEADEEQGKIDKRLHTIQQEENAPYEAKIITEEQNQTQTQVIDPKHIENSQKIDKIEKIKAQNTKEETTKKPELIDKIQNKKPQEQAPLPTQKNLIIVSKVLVGRYLTFEEAQKMQAMIKEKDPSTTPFVRKTGDVYTVQMGSYQDFTTAKNQAQFLKAKGLDVWIYQQ